MRGKEIKERPFPKRWSDQLSIKVEVLDQDNRKLFDMIERCREIIKLDSDAEKLGRLLFDLFDYTQYHFDREMAVMEACNMEGLDEHRADHEMMVKKVEQFLSAPEPYVNIELPCDLLEFLEGWFINHIMDKDLKLVPYVSDNVDLIESVLKNIKKNNHY